MRLNGGFPIVYADCPWAYDNPQDHDPARGGTPYPQLSLEKLCGLAPLIDRVAAKDCALFMWATVPKIPEALACMAAWNFSWVTVPFVWIKLYENGEVWSAAEQDIVDTNGMLHALYPKDLILSGGVVSGQGYWSNGNIEFCMMGKRGSPKRVARNVKQLVFEPISTDTVETVPIINPRLRPHSTKPLEVAKRIKLMMGEDVPGLELFARPRTSHKGWLLLGYEVDGLDIREALTRLGENT